MADDPQIRISIESDRRPIKYKLRPVQPQPKSKDELETESFELTISKVLDESLQAEVDSLRTKLEKLREKSV